MLALKNKQYDRDLNMLHILLLIFLHDNILKICISTKKEVFFKVNRTMRWSAPKVESEDILLNIFWMSIFLPWCHAKFEVSVNNAE